MYSAEEITKLFTDALDQYEWTTTLQEVDGHYSYKATDEPNSPSGYWVDKS